MHTENCTGFVNKSLIKNKKNNNYNQRSIIKNENVTIKVWLMVAYSETCRTSQFEID